MMGGRVESGNLDNKGCIRYAREQLQPVELQLVELQLVELPGAFGNVMVPSYVERLREAHMNL